jgi:hypothetical protein
MVAVELEDAAAGAAAVGVAAAGVELAAAALAEDGVVVAAAPGVELAAEDEAGAGDDRPENAVAASEGDK